LLDGRSSVLNGCFSVAKYELAPNAEANYKRSIEAMSSQKPGCNPLIEPCCDGFFNFALPACNSGGIRSGKHSMSRMWGASGAGVVLLPEKDEEVKFNSMRLHTLLLWHHGHNRFVSEKCE